MTAEGVATSAISKTEFRTGPFLLRVRHCARRDRIDLRRGGDAPNTGCFYYFDLAAKADFDTWGYRRRNRRFGGRRPERDGGLLPGQRLRSRLDRLFSRSAPTATNSRNSCPIRSTWSTRSPLTEEGRPLTGVTRETVRTEAFVPTDDCTFGISFRNVSVTAFDISVRPSNAATRYYIGVCSKELFDKIRLRPLRTPSSRWRTATRSTGPATGIHRTGDVTVDTDADLAMGDLDAGTDYVAVVFGVSTEGVRARRRSPARCSEPRTCSFDDDDRPERPRRYGFGRQIRRNAVEYRRGLFRRRLRLR